MNFGYQCGHRLVSILYKVFSLPFDRHDWIPTPKMAQFRSATQKEFAALMSKIWESEQTLNAMYCRAVTLQGLLSSSDDGHAGVSLLPVEVLGMIFKEVVGRPEDCKPAFELNKPEWPVIRPELLISQVSRYWRAVAIGTPSLWTYIRLYIKQSVDLVDLYLIRSRGLPLVIAFQQHSVCELHPLQVYAADCTRITSTILDHIHLCCRLEIRTNIPVPDLLTGLGRSCAPLLKEFTLHHPRSDIPEPFSSTFPALTQLELGPLILIASATPIKNLTSLTLIGLPAFSIPAANFINLLSGLRSLSHLALLDEVVRFEPSHATNAIEMSSLRSLMLKPGPDISRIYLTGLLETVITPVIERLVLDFTNISSPREIHLFLRHLKREAPRFISLRHTTINYPFEGFDIVDALVHSAPNIESLSLSRYSIDSVLAYLVHDARREAFPQLRVLQLGSPQFDWDTIFSFLCKRKQLGRPLHYIGFTGFGGSEGNVLDRLFARLLEACLVTV